jgi:RHS repeat-associated protein
MRPGDFTGRLQVREKRLQDSIYVSSIGRFAQADSIIPNPTNPQAYNRFSYVINNPLRFVDRSGHGYDDIDQERNALINRLKSVGIDASDWSMYELRKAVRALRAQGVDFEKVAGINQKLGRLARGTAALRCADPEAVYCRKGYLEISNDMIGKELSEFFEEVARIYGFVINAAKLVLQGMVGLAGIGVGAYIGQLQGSVIGAAVAIVIDIGIEGYASGVVESQLALFDTITDFLEEAWDAGYDVYVGFDDQTNLIGAGYYVQGENGQDFVSAEGEFAETFFQIFLLMLNARYG